VEAVPLRDMGRFVHEAVAVDPRTGIVYETEDVRWSADDPFTLPGSGFYRFLPTTPGRLAAGGRLQILAVRGRPQYNTVIGQRVGERIPVEWLDIDDPDPIIAETDPAAVFRRGYRDGAALFQRLEGCFWTDDSCYFVSTSGGEARAGQVWRYVPDGDGEWMTLVFESPGRDVLDAPDNICTTQRGGLIICEDGLSDQYVRGLTAGGAMIDLVRQPVIAGEPNPTEFAGCCFSPDMSVLFFNVQGSTRSYLDRTGYTYALWGPWERGAL
jgi:secreted PhoX family phosphatase